MVEGLQPLPLLMPPPPTKNPQRGWQHRKPTGRKYRRSWGALVRLICKQLEDQGFPRDSPQFWGIKISQVGPATQLLVTFSESFLSEPQFAHL